MNKYIQNDHPRYSIRREKLSGRCTLKIKKVERVDAGEFTCEINDVLKTSCQVVVTEPEFRFREHLPVNIKEIEKRSVTLECEIDDAEAECEWYFNGKV